MDTDTLRTEILDSLDREVDALADLGMDRYGDQPVDSKFESVDEGTLITFPPGEYRWEESHWLKNIKGLALVATADPGEVRFTVPRGYVGRIFNFRDACDDILLEGITFDQRDDWDTSIGNVIQVDDGGRALLKDVEYAGWNPHEQMGATSSLNCWALSEDSVIVLDGFVQEGRAAWADYPDNPLCVFAGKASVGTLYVRNSRFQNCGEHAIYASRCGPVRIENSYFKNNQNTHARISGADSYCVDSTFVWRDDAAVRDDTDSRQGRTGLVWESGDLGKAGGLVQTCEFICHHAPKMSGCLKVDGSHGALDVRDCYFKVHADGAEPFWADAPGDSHMIDGQPAEPWDVRMEHCTFEGAGGFSRDGHEAAVRVASRSGSLFRDVEVRMPNRAGFRLADGAYTMENVTIDVGADYEPVITDNAEVNRDTMPDPEYDHELRVIAPPDAVVEYRFVVSDGTELVTSGEYSASPKGETVAELADGTWSIEGICAREGGDTFVYNGDILAYETLAGPDPLAYVDGQRITLDDYRDTSEPEPEPEGPTRAEYETFVQTVEQALTDLKEG